MKRFRGSNPRLSSSYLTLDDIGRIDAMLSKPARERGLCEEPVPYRGKLNGRFCGRKGNHVLYTIRIGALMFMCLCGHHRKEYPEYGFYYLHDTLTTS